MLEKSNKYVFISCAVRQYGIRIGKKSVLVPIFQENKLILFVLSYFYGIRMGKYKVLIPKTAIPYYMKEIVIHED